MNTPNPERRSERAKTAILDAALELSRDPGFEATSVEAIAKRAGVGKQTIYRWWPSKAAVILEALSTLAGTTLEFPDTGDVMADLGTQMTAVARAFTTAEFTPFTGLVAAAQSDPALAESLIATVIQPRVDACRERLETAQRQGQLRPDVDLEEVIELLYGPLYYRLLFRTRPITRHQAKDIIDLAFAGLLPQKPRKPRRASSAHS